MNDFKDQTVIVTGGGGGIGGATCRRFGAAGAKVAVFDMNLAAAQKVAEGITAQGGIGTVAEDQLLHREYGVDGTGWGTPFLLVPEAVNVDAETLRHLMAAGSGDVWISGNSPLGVPFWNLRSIDHLLFFAVDADSLSASPLRIDSMSSFSIDPVLMSSFSK